MKPTDAGLATLIEDIRRVHPNPDGTFAEVLMYLRELQRLRAALPKLKDGSPVVPGQTLYFAENGRVEQMAVAAVDQFDACFPPSEFKSRDLREFYATKEEAELAVKGEG